MIPSRALVLLFVGPLILSFLTLLDRSLLLYMLATDGAIVVLAGIDALLARRPLVSVERRVAHVLSIGRPNVVTLELRSSARRKLRVLVQDDLFSSAESEDLPLSAELPARGRATLRYRLKPSRRGAHTLGAHHVRYASPLGLWIRQLRIADETQVKVYPDLEAVRAYELLARQDRDPAGVRASRRRGGESEFERLREYRREDEYRSIDWKATARRKKVIAREYQLESDQNVVFMLDGGRLMTAESGGLSLFDHALNATLMLSHVASRGGDKVGMIAFAEEVKAYAPLAGGARATQKIVQAGYDLEPALVETSYASAFEQLHVRVKKRTLVVLFTQVVDDVASAELSKLLRGLLPRHLPLMVLLRDVDVDALVEGRTAETAALGGVAPYLRGAAAELSGFRDKLVRNLKQQGALVLDVAPEELTPALINRYLEIKARHLL
ncbi:DUF58 domain-containing protein [Polyangium aurulentum]|uniref:DUF58 domain-containing protein n=1 Tax=Polyangium aurulentum TaxID=2567896 RepID=UPI0010AE7717|nr:DUF58 domain-containing protein [Polyangium aurulentum]UQA59573.1 DUF58 domain-containing protein [Polyangium aurulentum]